MIQIKYQFICFNQYFFVSLQYQTKTTIIMNITFFKSAFFINLLIIILLTTFAVEMYLMQNFNMAMGSSIIAFVFLMLLPSCSLEE